MQVRRKKKKNFNIQSTDCFRIKIPFLRNALFTYTYMYTQYTYASVIQVYTKQKSIQDMAIVFKYIYIYDIKFVQLNKQVLYITLLNLLLLFGWALRRNNAVNVIWRLSRFSALPCFISDTSGASALNHRRSLSQLDSFLT